MAGLSLSTVLGWRVLLSVQMGKVNWEECEWSSKNDWKLGGTRYLVIADCLAYREGRR